MTTQTEQRVSELFSTHIYAAPEVLFEIMYRLWGEACVNNAYEYDLMPIKEPEGSGFITLGPMLPEDLMREISLEMKQKIKTMVYDVDYLRKPTHIDYNIVSTMQY